jgi:hypothetical protein
MAHNHQWIQLASCCPGLCACWPPTACAGHPCGQLHGVGCSPQLVGLGSEAAAAVCAGWLQAELERLLGGGTPDVAGEGGDQASKAMQKQASMRKGPKAAGTSKGVTIQGGRLARP